MSAVFARQVAVVSGAASGIGRACALRLARSGASVALLDLDADRLSSVEKEVKDIEGAGAAASYVLDVSDAKAVRSTVQKVVERQGPPAVLVNSAGITRDGQLHRITEENWDAVVAVNLKGTFLLTQTVSRHMIEEIRRKARATIAGGELELRGGALCPPASDDVDLVAESTFSGSIVNISSIVGKMGNFGQTNYAASKAGVVGLTKTAARELGRYGIRVNAIQPGFIETPMTDKVPDKVMRSMLQQIPLARMGQPSEIADAAHYLASRESSYVTGAILEVSGGFGM